MTRPPDRVEVIAGVTNISAQIRDVARLANAAGLDGFEVAGVEIGIDRESLAESLSLARELDFLRMESPRVYITISYQEKPDATEKEKR